MNKGNRYSQIQNGIVNSIINDKTFIKSLDEVIEDLKNLQGQYVKATYVERYRTFPWWGETRYFVTKVEKEKSPIFGK